MPHSAEAVAEAVAPPVMHSELVGASSAAAAASELVGASSVAAASEIVHGASSAPAAHHLRHLAAGHPWRPAAHQRGQAMYPMAHLAIPVSKTPEEFPPAERPRPLGA